MYYAGLWSMQVSSHDMVMKMTRILKKYDKFFNIFVIIMNKLCFRLELFIMYKPYMHGLVQDCSNSSVLTINM